MSPSSWATWMSSSSTRQATASSVDEARSAATELHALIRGLWLNFMLNPRDVAREMLAAQAASFIDRLTGAPVRIVRDHIIARPAPERGMSEPKAKPARKVKEPVSKQLDIEDLFGNRA